MKTSMDNISQPSLPQHLFAGSPSSIHPEVLTLIKHVITEKSQIPPMRFLFKIFDVPCFPRGELVAIAGKAKSGKTFFLSLLMAASIRESLMAIERLPPLLPDDQPPEEGVKAPPLKVLWYDTEQSEQSTQDILVNRIIPLVGDEQKVPVSEHILAFNVRLFDWEERLKMFEKAIPCMKPDLVILDGVRDLISDINDGKEAQRITEQLMALAQNNNCCIVCVLHQNKSDSDRNLRGWIGTELTNKVFEVYCCEKLRDCETFKVEQTHTRKFDIGQELYYKVQKDSGLPVITEKPQPTAEKPRDAQGRFISPKSYGAIEWKWESFNRDYLIYHNDSPDNSYEWDLRKLFTDALSGESYKPYGVVMGIGMRLSNIQDGKLYYALFEEAVRRKIIVKETIPQTGQQIVRLFQNCIPFDNPDAGDPPF